MKQRQLKLGYQPTWPTWVPTNKPCVVYFIAGPGTRVNFKPPGPAHTPENLVHLEDDLVALEIRGNALIHGFPKRIGQIVCDLYTAIKFKLSRKFKMASKICKF
jgi:hypothetical protein